MGTLEFFASVVSSLAWPLVVLYLAITFRSQLRDAVAGLAKRMGHLRRVQAMGVNAEFAEEVEAVKEQVNETMEFKTPLGPKVDSSNRGTRDRVGSDRDSAPRIRVIEAFLLMEQEAFSAADRAGWTSDGSGRTLGTALKFLHTRFDLSSAFMETANQLRRLRNEAAHSSDFAISDAAAEHYETSALTFADYLNNLPAGRPR